MTLPHRFPFRLIDRHSRDRATYGVTGGGFFTRGSTPLSPAWMAEAMAQAAAVLLEAPPDGAEALVLAGLEGVTVTEPVLPGARLEIEVTLAARLGGLVKVEAVAWLEGRAVARGNLVLARAGGASS